MKLNKVLAYLYHIRGKQTVVGVHNKEPNASPNRQTERVYGITGAYPALWSGDLLFAKEDVGHRWTMIKACKKQWDNGLIVQIMLHVVSPAVAEPGPWEGGVVSHLDDGQWTSLITDGGALNIIWKKRLDEYAVYLEYLKKHQVTVLFRPFHEMNQGVFWWAGRPGDRGTAALYRLTHDYLTIEKGLTNLIWVWNMQDLDYEWSKYNPGNDYWDIFAVDIYEKDGFTACKYQEALDIAGEKPIAIGECSVLPTAEQLKEQPLWVFCMSWAELTFEHNTDSQLQDLYRAENIVTSDKLPDLKE